MKSRQNIFLVGPMGVGKTTIGRLLADRLGRHFYDTDRVIEERTGADIPWIFDVEGEAGFRSREQAVCAELAKKDSLVIATGGGIVVNPENRKAIRRDGIVIFLSATVEQLVERTAKDTRRPLLQNDNPRKVITDIFEARLPLYQELADITITTDQSSPRLLINDIVRQLDNLNEDINR